MSELIVRLSRGFFEPHIIEEVIARLEEGRSTLEPALKALPGLLHYYVAVDKGSGSMVNVSIWDSLTHAKQMDRLPEMLAQRETFVGLGVRFEPVRNYQDLWSVTP